MDRMKSISMCVYRFDEETKSAMIDLYTKVDAETAAPSETPAEPEGIESDEGLSDEVPW